MTGPQIDWEELAKSLNYDCEKSMWDDLYVKKNWGFRKIGLEIGPYPSHQAVRNRIKFLKYKVKPAEGNNRRKYVDDLPKL